MSLAGGAGDCGGDDPERGGCRHAAHQRPFRHVQASRAAQAAKVAMIDQ